MLHKISKITLKTWEKYFVFVFLAVFLSLFSYMLGNNIVLSVKDYLQDQIKPLVGGDIVVSNRNDTDEIALREKYKSIFYIAKTIEINTTLFDSENNPSLVELVYHSENYPFYNQFEYDVINAAGTLIVNQNTLEKYGNSIEILWEKYLVKWVIKKSPLGNISIYASQNTLYLPIEAFDTSLNATNSRLDYRYYLLFKWKYDESYKEILKSDPILEDFWVRSLSDRDESIWDITDRFYVFINFFNLVVFVLTFFIVIVSLETFFKKIKPTLGLLNIFWLKKKEIFYYNFFVLLGVFLSSFLLAYLFNIAVMKWFSLEYDFFESKVTSFYQWFFITIVLLFVGVLSPVYKIWKSDISSLLKDEGNFSNFSNWDYFVYLGLIFAWFLGVNLISGISFFESIWYSAWFIALIVVFYVLIEKILYMNFQFFFFKKKVSFLKDFYLFDAIRSTIKPGNVSFLIIFASVISFISIFIFYVFSWSFLNYLQNITKTSNDTFVINVQQNDIENIKEYFSDEEIFEIVTLKIKKVNGQTLEKYLWVENVSRQFSREFSSTTKVLENKILSWKSLSAWGVSVDREFALELGLTLWDKITFSVAWLEKTLEVINLREAVRNGTNPFFYFQLEKSDFEKFPKNYILSYKESLKSRNIEKILSREVGNHLTFIKTREIIEIVIEIAKQILLVVYLCLGYIFVFSFLSFLVSLSFLSTFKTAKFKLLHILWGKRKKLLQALSFEFSYLVFTWFLLSFIFGSVILFSIFSFIKYFDLDLRSFFIGTLIIFLLFFVKTLYVKIFQKKNLQS